MTPIASAPAALDKKQILALCQQHLKVVFSEHLDRQIEVDRFHQVANALRNELFWRGKQHIALGFDEGDGSATWKSVIPDSDLKDNQQALAYTINITRSDGQKFISVVGTRAPHAKVSATKPEDVEMVRKARRGDAATDDAAFQLGTAHDTPAGPDDGVFQLGTGFDHGSGSDDVDATQNSPVLNLGRRVNGGGIHAVQSRMRG